MWHCAQFVVMPVWFISVPGPQAVKFVVVWQNSQLWLASVGICAGTADDWPLASLPLWQVTQLVTMPAWFITPVFQFAGLESTAAAVVAWHSSHGWAVVMWVA